MIVLAIPAPLARWLGAWPIRAERGAIERALQRYPGAIVVVCGGDVRIWALV